MYYCFKDINAVIFFLNNQNKVLIYYDKPRVFYHFPSKEYLTFYDIQYIN